MGSILTGYITLEAAGGVSKMFKPTPGTLARTIYDKMGGANEVTDYGVAGYRYSGKTPNNYITFNGESWRIIGVIDGSQIGKEAGIYYTKIIRNASLETELAWDTNSKNTWSTSTLYSTLNGNAPYTGNPNVESVDWHHTSQGSSSVLTTAMYTNEGWGTSCTTSSKNCTHNAKVGLMSPSDYGYASSSCYSSTSLYSYDSDTCENSNWLFLCSDEWLLEPGLFAAYHAWDVTTRGMVHYSDHVAMSYAVRPVVYLKSATTILGGDGKVGSPYTYE